MTAMLPPEQIAANIRQVLAADVTTYRNFGVYWYFVKAFLKRFYDREQLPLLGDYEQPEVVERMPAYDNFSDAMHDALLYWRTNWENNHNEGTSTAPDGEPVTVFDTDVGL